MAGQGTNHLTRELADFRAAEFIEDGTKTIIACSACGKDLVEIWMVRPDAPLKTELVVSCPYCGDKSFQQNIKGQYCLGNLESREVIMVETPTKVTTAEDGSLLQKVTVQTEIRGQ